MKLQRFAQSCSQKHPIMKQGAGATLLVYNAVINTVIYIVLLYRLYTMRQGSSWRNNVTEFKLLPFHQRHTTRLIFQTSW